MWGRQGGRTLGVMGEGSLQEVHVREERMGGRVPKAEFPLVLKSTGPGTSSSMKLGSFLLFKGPLTTIGVSLFIY